MDDHNAVRWHGPRFSNTDSVFSRVHERSTKRGAKNIRPVTERFRTSRCGRQPRLCRSRKQDFVRLCHESNGTIASAKRKIAALGRRSLQVKTAQLREESHTLGAPGVAPCLFANDGDEDFSQVGCATVFEQENALPGSELHLTIDNRHGLAGTRQYRADMRWHIIAAFGTVREVIGFFRYEAV